MVTQQRRPVNFNSKKRAGPKCLSRSAETSHTTVTLQLQNAADLHLAAAQPLNPRVEHGMVHALRFGPSEHRKQNRWPT